MSPHNSHLYNIIFIILPLYYPGVVRHDEEGQKAEDEKL